MQTKLFGTDGIRGLANFENLSAASVLAIGQALGYILRKKTSGKPRVILCEDTRISAEMITSALVAGLSSEGVDVYRAGVLPTPAVPKLILKYRADAGIAVTASHNSFEDNGLKMFDSRGLKISRQIESEIEQITHNIRLGDHRLLQPRFGSEVGRVTYLDNAARHYVESLYHLTPRSYAHSGLKIALDCANGASSLFATTLFEDIGHSVYPIGITPDGVNINDHCGATHTDTLVTHVTSCGADVGIAFDGDADRCILVDHEGCVVDGDRVLAILGTHLHTKEALERNLVIATVMSNVGLDSALSRQGVRVIRTKVGDRFVAEKMREVGACLGGEKSGHTIIGSHAAVGDGVATALSILDVMWDSGKSLKDLSSVMEEFPQELINIKVTSKIPLDQLPETQALVSSARKVIGDFGDVVVRYSGTESLARVMVQGEDACIVKAQAQSIAECMILETQRHSTLAIS